MIKTARGFTLLEIMLGVLILAGVSLMFFQTVTSTSKESTFSGNHLSAIMLSQKVSEDIIEEFSINPHAEETLGLNGVSSQKTSMIDGDSIFFLAIEDKKAPWGVIDSAADGGIDMFQEPLYSQLNGFFLSTSSAGDYFDGFFDQRNNLQEIKIGLNWKNSMDTGKSEKRFFVFAPRDPKKFVDPLAGIDYAALGLEDAVKNLLPAGTDFSKPLSEIISGLDSDQKILFEFASTQVLCDNFFKSPLIRKMASENVVLTNKLGFVTDLKTGFEIRSKIAANWYEVTRLSFDVVAAVAKHMGTVAEEDTAGKAFENMDQFKLGISLKNIKAIYRYFLDAMISARYYYQTLITPKMTRFAGQKKQLEIIIRLFDIYRILAFAPGHGNGKAEYIGYISRIKEMSAWRNQYLYRFTEQERKYADDLDALVAKFPNIKPTYDILTVQIPRVFAYINQQNAN